MSYGVLFIVFAFIYITLHCLTDRIISAMDKNKIPLNIYLDLSKAFDTLDHAILLDTLFHYGIRGNPLKLISSYLENRQQFVEFRNTK